MKNRPSSKEGQIAVSFLVIGLIFGGALSYLAVSTPTKDKLVAVDDCMFTFAIGFNEFVSGGNNTLTERAEAEARLLECYQATKT